MKIFKLFLRILLYAGILFTVGYCIYTIAGI